MAKLASQHRDLPAVVGVVRDQVSEKSRHIRAEASDAAIPCQSLAENQAQSVAASF